MVAPTKSGCQLKVTEAASKDVGRGIARLDADDMAAVGVSTGDYVLITGGKSGDRKTTVCRVMPSLKEHRGSSRVQLDGIARENCGAAIDDKVTVEAAAPAEASKVTLFPLTIAPTARDLAYIATRIDGLAAMPGDRVRVQLFGARSADFRIEAAAPQGAVVITENTKLELKGATAAPKQQAPAAVSYEDIGGLKPQLSRIREMIELPLRYPHVFERLGIDPPKGVLLHGPPGTGKTLIARTIAHECDANFFTISGPEIVQKHYGESEGRLRQIWAQASKAAPSIIFIDEIDSIAPRRDNTQGEVEKRIVAQLLALMDGLTKRENVIVIAATNLPNNIDPALRRPGRFDREIEIAVPDRHGRREILDVHSRGMPLADDVDLDRLAEITHGCVGADLEAFCREAAMACLRSVFDDIDMASGDIPYDTIAALTITQDHFQQALSELQPSAVREVFVESPNVRWSDIGGLEDIKRQLVEAVEWPLSHGKLFEAADLRPPKGVLLAGPPGVGKTLLAKALATETDANFISVKGPELLSRYVGDSEKGLREIFKKARQASPCIVFFDEIDALAPKRGRGGGASDVTDRILAQFLTELDGVDALRDVLVLAATNRKDILDPALLRPGRFDSIVQLGEPDPTSRAAIFRVHLDDRPTDADPMELAESLAKRTEGFSGAEIAAVCDRAAMAAVRRAVAQANNGDSADVILRTDDLNAEIDAAIASAGGPPPKSAE